MVARIAGSTKKSFQTFRDSFTLLICCRRTLRGSENACGDLSWGAIVGEVAGWLVSLGVTGAVAATGALALFRLLGNKWIEDHFAKELEGYKTERLKELEKLRTEYGRETERLKADLNRFADRATRFHDREYEVLPEAWGLMNKAYGAASHAIVAFQQHPDLNRMAQPEFESWLERSGLDQYQKNELASALDKNRHYIQLNDWKKIVDAEHAAMEFINYVILQGVFIDENLSEKMMNAGTNIRKALISRSMVERMKGLHPATGQPDFWLQASEEIAEVGPVVLEVKQAVRQRLADIRLTANEP